MRGEATGNHYQLAGFDNDEVSVGVENENLLKPLIKHSLAGDENQLIGIRETIINEMGHESLVDAVSIISNFECMNRIADACGISVDQRMLDRSSGLIDELNIRHYHSAKNTPGAYQERN